MAFYMPRSPGRSHGMSSDSIDFNRLHSYAPSSYIRMHRGPAYPVTINHGVETTYRTASLFPSTFTEDRRSYLSNSLDNGVGGYNGLPSIRNLINLNDSYESEPGSSPENPIYIEGAQEASQLRENGPPRTEATPKATSLSSGMTYTHPQRRNRILIFARRPEHRQCWGVLPYMLSCS
ncbi:hypothetical protein ACJ73_02995 [Blastomyces percursus]|uniref:Uncharacterized protein n=1 Tax=Blastomyces percursus TaxID=1658174 RepID=A0A1J9QC35_9EURO|nr:hypothetical protein ACJ73_02995 [Blastomyces percursus]